MAKAYVLTSIHTSKFNETVMIHGVASDEAELLRMTDELERMQATSGLAVTVIPVDEVIAPKIGAESYHERANW